jgi:hypothetical protein
VQQIAFKQPFQIMVHILENLGRITTILV